MDIDVSKIEFLEATGDIGLHEHLCLIYENHEEQLGAIVPFFKTGLKRNEKCVYIADDNTAGDVIGALKQIDENLFCPAIGNNKFSVLSKNDAYLKGGYFSPEKMIGFLEENINQSLASGYTGLRATGEMTWMFGPEPGVERMMEYEAKLNDFLPIQKACAICQYNKNRFSPEMLLKVFQTHPKVIYKNKILINPLYLSQGKTQELMDRMAEVFAR